MRFTETKLPGVFLIDPVRNADERGYFSRTWAAGEFAAHGLTTHVAQCSVSFNHRRGTLRGMHFQEAPHAEAKLVRCTRGAIYDVAVDLRPESPAYLNWYAAELTADNGRMLYISEGCAHGFLTLAEASEVYYMISVPYQPDATRGVRWDDPAFSIAWPWRPRIIADRDRTYPFLKGQE